ncbi:MAG: hypothetical protein ABI598_03905 [Chloroflexota bacterium]
MRFQSRTRGSRAIIRSALLASAIALVAGTVPVFAAPFASGADQAAFARVRAATAAYHDLAAAKAANFGLFPGCFTDPAGGMGIHYVNFGSVDDGVVDPLKPEALVYEPKSNGNMRLVAVEYVQLASTWMGSEPPSVYGHPLEFTPAPNEFGLPDFYELHVWLWQPNPTGMFTEWNPSVSCPA